MNELVRAGELQKIEPDFIEGEFKVEEESGFGCRWCGSLLFVGSIQCHQCGQEFSVPTPPLKVLGALKHVYKMQGMAAIYKDRRTAGEIEAIRLHNPSYYPPK